MYNIMLVSDVLHNDLTFTYIPVCMHTHVCVGVLYLLGPFVCQCTLGLLPYLSGCK